MSESTCDLVDPRLTSNAVPLAVTRKRPGGSPRTWAVAAAVAVIGAATLGAQIAPIDSAIPLASSAKRLPQLEQQVAASAGGFAREVRVYRWAAPIEPMFRYYEVKLGGVRDVVLDTSSAIFMPGATTRVSYQLDFHVLQDQCTDSTPRAAAPGAAPATCKSWRRARDKKRALSGRVGPEPGAWLERATFTWFVRDTTGELYRWRMVLRDSGLSDNWQHYTPLTDLTLERVQLTRKTP